MLSLAFAATAISAVAAQLSPSSVTNAIQCSQGMESNACSYNTVATSSSDCAAIASGLQPMFCSENNMTAQQSLDCSNGLNKTIANCNYAFSTEGASAYAFSFAYQAIGNVQPSSGGYTPPTFTIACSTSGAAVCSVSVSISEPQDCAYLRSKCLTDGSTAGFCNGLPTDKPSNAYSLHMQCVERYNMAVDACFEWMYSGLGPTTFNLSFDASLTSGTVSPSATATQGSGASCWAAYDSSVNYPPSSKVSWNGVNYQNKWWENAGYSPNPTASNSDGGWVSQGSCSGVVPTTTTYASSSATPTSYSDGSTCAAGPGTPTVNIGFEISTDQTTLYTAATCNAACAASGKAGVNYSGMVQMGSFVSCYCLIDFTVTVTTGCSSCVTYPTHVGYPQANFANCGSGNPSDGAIVALSVLAIGSSGSSCWTAYDSTTNYPPSSQVSYNGVNWKNKWWENAGFSPDPTAANFDYGWVSQGACGSNSASAKGGSKVPVASGVSANKDMAKSGSSGWGNWF